MGYYGRRYSRQPRQNNPELVSRIEKVAARGVSSLTDWERNFLTSLRESAKKWGRLTAKQHEIFQRIEKNSDPDVIAARNWWRDNWTEEKRELAVFAANYYKANPPYFGDAAARILNDSEYIPSEKLYRKMVENKYVTRAYENNNMPIKFPAGTMVCVRDSSQVGGRARAYRGKLAMVISVSEHALHATRGARSYCILPIGADRQIETEERYLKTARS